MQLHAPFGFISDVLIKHGLRQVGWELRPKGHENDFWMPEGFVFDFESTPNWLRGPLGENKRGGAGHDGASRKNVFVSRGLTSDELALLNDPNTSKEDVTRLTLIAKGKITKSIAADVYFELMEYCDSIDTQRFAEHKHPFLPKPIIVPYVKTTYWMKRWLKSSVVRIWPGDYWQKYEMTATALEIYGLKGDPYVTIEEKIEEIIEKTEQVAEDIKASPDAQAPAIADKVDMIAEDLKDAKDEVVEKL